MIPCVSRPLSSSTIARYMKDLFNKFHKVYEGIIQEMPQGVWRTCKGYYQTQTVPPPLSASQQRSTFSLFNSLNKTKVKLNFFGSLFPPLSPPGTLGLSYCDEVDWRCEVENVNFPQDLSRVFTRHVTWIFTGCLLSSFLFLQGVWYHSDGLRVIMAGWRGISALESCKFLL